MPMNYMLQSFLIKDDFSSSSIHFPVIASYLLCSYSSFFTASIHVLEFPSYRKSKGNPLEILSGRHGMPACNSCISCKMTIFACISLWFACNSCIFFFSTRIQCHACSGFPIGKSGHVDFLLEIQWEANNWTWANRKSMGNLHWIS